MSASRRLILLYAVASLAAVAVGCFICARSGVPAGSWLRNLIAWAVGAAAAGAIFAFSKRPAVLTPLLLALIGCAVTFVGPDQQGVHRWIDLGPLHVTVAFIVLPAAVVALASRPAPWVWGVALAVMTLLFLQPDASQVSAFGAALIVIALRASASKPVRLGLIAAVGLLAAAAWFRPDPLGAVAEVEGVIGLAYGLSPVLAALAVILLAAALLAPALAAPRASTAAWALSAYSLTVAAAAAFGAFPVPLVGVGMSPIVGLWLGVGLLAAVVREVRVNH